MPKSQVNIRMPPTLIETLRVRAEHLGLSFTELLTRLASQPLQELEFDCSLPKWSETADASPANFSQKKSHITKPSPQVTESNWELPEQVVNALNQLEFRLSQQIAEQLKQIQQLEEAIALVCTHLENSLPRSSNGLVSTAHSTTFQVSKTKNNLKPQQQPSPLKCSSCKSTSIRFNGLTNGGQKRYFCKTCRKVFQ